MVAPPAPSPLASLWQCPWKCFPGHFAHPPARLSCVSEAVSPSRVKSFRSSSLDIDACSSTPSPLTTFCSDSLESCRWNTFSSIEPVASSRYR